MLLEPVRPSSAATPQHPASASRPSNGPPPRQSSNFYKPHLQKRPPLSPPGGSDSTHTSANPDTSPHPAASTRTEYHDAAPAWFNGTLLCFGGHRRDSLLASSATSSPLPNATLRYLPLFPTTGWVDVATTGEPPSARYGSLSAIHHARYWVIGGRSAAGVTLTDVFNVSMDADRRHWTRVSLSQELLLTSCPASLMLAPHLMLCHGGASLDGPHSESLYVVDLHTLSVNLVGTVKGVALERHQLAVVPWEGGGSSTADPNSPTTTTHRLLLFGGFLPGGIPNPNVYCASLTAEQHAALCRPPNSHLDHSYAAPTSASSASSRGEHSAVAPSTRAEDDGNRNRVGSSRVSSATSARSATTPTASATQRQSRPSTAANPPFLPRSVVELSADIVLQQLPDGFKPGYPFVWTGKAAVWAGPEPALLAVRRVRRRVDLHPATAAIDEASSTLPTDRRPPSPMARTSSPPSESDDDSYTTTFASSNAGTDVAASSGDATKPRDDTARDEQPAFVVTELWQWLPATRSAAGKPPPAPVPHRPLSAPTTVLANNVTPSIPFGVGAVGAIRPDGALLVLGRWTHSKTEKRSVPHLQSDEAEPVIFELRCTAPNSAVWAVKATVESRSLLLPSAPPMSVRNSRPPGSAATSRPAAAPSTARPPSAPAVGVSPRTPRPMATTPQHTAAQSFSASSVDRPPIPARPPSSGLARKPTATDAAIGRQVITHLQQQKSHDLALRALRSATSKTSAASTVHFKATTVPPSAPSASTLTDDDKAKEGQGTAAAPSACDHSGQPMSASDDERRIVEYNACALDPDDDRQNAATAHLDAADTDVDHRRGGPAAGGRLDWSSSIIEPQHFALAIGALSRSANVHTVDFGGHPPLSAFCEGLLVDLVRKCPSIVNVMWDRIHHQSSQSAPSRPPLLTSALCLTQLSFALIDNLLAAEHDAYAHLMAREACRRRFRTRKERRVQTRVNEWQRRRDAIDSEAAVQALLAITTKEARAWCVMMERFTVDVIFHRASVDRFTVSETIKFKRQCKLQLSQLEDDEISLRETDIVKTEGRAAQELLRAEKQEMRLVLEVQRIRAKKLRQQLEEFERDERSVRSEERLAEDRARVALHGQEKKLRQAIEAIQLERKRLEQLELQRKVEADAAARREAERVQRLQLEIERQERMQQDALKAQEFRIREMITNSQRTEGKSLQDYHRTNRNAIEKRDAFRARSEQRRRAGAIPPQPLVTNLCWHKTITVGNRRPVHLYLASMTDDVPEMTFKVTMPPYMAAAAAAHAAGGTKSASRQQQQDANASRREPTEITDESWLAQKQSLQAATMTIAMDPVVPGLSLHLTSPRLHSPKLPHVTLQGDLTHDSARLIVAAATTGGGEGGGGAAPPASRSRRRSTPTVTWTSFRSRFSPCI